MEILLLIELGLDEEEDAVTVVYCVVVVLLTVPPESSCESFLTGGGAGARLEDVASFSTVMADGGPAFEMFVIFSRLESVEPRRFSGTGAGASFSTFDANED